MESPNGREDDVSVEETRLYQPVKDYFTRRGYTVRGEVNGCDLVACRDDELIVVELKKSVNLTLVLQGIDRQRMTDFVYLAVKAPKNARHKRWQETIRLCRMLGLGLLAVTFRRRGAFVEAACEPGPYTPRPSLSRRRMLEREFARRSGDYNTGGSTGRKIITAYREEAIHIAAYLHQHGPTRLSEIRGALGGEKTASILQKNYYGWFVRVERGVYRLSAEGSEALSEYRERIESL